MKAFSARLRFCRQQAGLTQKSAAARLEIAFSTYRRYEQGETEPSISEARHIAEFYGVTLDYLSGRTRV